MHRRLRGCFAIVLMLGAALARAQEGLQTLDEAWVRAMKAGDLEAVVALYAADAVYYPPDTMEAKGTAAIRENYGGLLAAFRVREATLTPSAYRTVGDVSFGWGRFSLTLVAKEGGEPTTLEGRYTAIARKEGGKWLYLADHASSPLPPPGGSRFVPANVTPQPR